MKPAAGDVEDFSLCADALFAARGAARQRVEREHVFCDAERRGDFALVV